MGNLTRLLEPLAAGAVRAASRLTMLPDRGTLRVPGLTAGVTVRYDAHHVPHIDAESDADAFRAQGVCHALDRFFQMDILRHALGGRISELVGEKPLGALASPPFGHRNTTVNADRFMRSLGLARSARQVWQDGGTEARALLTAYVEGVNAVVPWLRRKRPLEHRMLRIPIRTWSPIDSILVAKGMALGLSFKWRTAPVFAELASRLSDRPDHLRTALPRSPDADALAVTRWIQTGVSGAMGFVPFDAPLAGSNAWLVGRDRSASGMPLLASDPHLELSLPAIWYLTSMQGARYEAVGCSLAGLPGIVIGRTPDTAWGLTNGMIDDGDFWAETLDDAGRRYRVDGRWRSLEIETETIRTKGGAPTVVRVRRTHRGPLITDAFPGYAGAPLSLRLTLMEADADLESFIGLGRARTASAAIEAAKHFGAPAQNLLVADTTGDARFRLIGKLPLRSMDTNPALPRDGTRSDTDWQGWVPADETPAATVGPDEVLVQANHAHVAGNEPHYLSHLYEPPYRATRIHERLAGRGLTPSQMQAIQHDALNGCAAVFKEFVLLPHAEAVRRVRPTVGALLDRLLAWDGDERADAPGGPQWHLVYYRLVRRVFEPMLGPVIVDRWMGLVNYIDEPLLAAFRDDDNPWAPPGVRATLLCEALDDALKDMARLGLSVDTSWGAFHQLTLRHPMSLGPLAAAFDQGPFPMPGGPFTVGTGQFLHSRPAAMRVGASYRQVVDLSAPAEGRMITFGGQSGYAGSPHYSDLTPLWLGDGTLPMRLAPPRDPKSILTLRP